MTLPFSLQLNGKPTYFPEKIMLGLGQRELTDEMAIYLNSDYHSGSFDYKPKIHSIRKDPFNRWHKDQKIHMVINNRTKKRLQFAPTVPVIRTQVIEILHHHGVYNWGVLIKIDGRTLGTATFPDKQVRLCDPAIEELALNDGFESAQEFLEYFDEDFTGKIIHWTHKKY